MTEAAFNFSSPEETRRRETKDKLIATIVHWARENGHASTGLDDHQAIAAAFSKVPDGFIWEAQFAIEGDDDNAFLDDLASTIEGELIKRAIGGQS